MGVPYAYHASELFRIARSIDDPSSESSIDIRLETEDFFRKELHTLLSFGRRSRRSHLHHIETICTNVSKTIKQGFEGTQRIRDDQSPRLRRLIPIPNTFEAWAAAVFVDTKVLNKDISTKIREISDTSLAAEINMMDLTCEPALEVSIRDPLTSKT